MAKENKPKKNHTRSGIRRRWLINSLSVSILIVVVGLSGFSVVITNYYYYSVVAYLEGRAETYAKFISTNYMKDYDTYQNSTGKLVFDFREGDHVELQFIDTSGRLQVSTAGAAPMAGQLVSTPDVRMALETGEMSHWIGEDSVTGERIVAVTSPLLFANTQTVGALRYVSSLELLDTRILYVIGLSGLVCVAVIFIVVSVNMLFIRTILNPIQEINRVTGRIAAGNYGVRIEKIYNDEIGELAAGINNMSAEIRAAERMKSDFISSVSHELRTPLTAINGWGETLLSAGTDDMDEVKKGIRIMLKETGRLSKMVEELLDFTRIEGGRVTLDVDRMSIAPELEEILYLQMDALKRVGITLKYEAEESIPDITGDRERLKQVFVNIIDNAAKHGGAGNRIDVRIYYERPWVCVSVRDYGQGILPEELPHVKYKFYKGSSVARGSGIGLAISDEIIRMHEGELDIASVVGEGTTVIIRIPAREI